MVRRNRVTNSPLEDLYDSFSILYPARRSDREKLIDLVTGQTPLNYSAFAILDFILTPALGARSPFCKTVVVEQRYRDRDHTSALASFYHKSFRPIDPECTRLHFFSQRFSTDDLGDLHRFTDQYIGYSVLRPFPFRRIGRTILKHIQRDPSTEFPVCDGMFQVNIGGSELSFEGTCFMEQDTVVAACASTSIWMSTTTLAQRFRLQECSTSQITEYANEYYLHNRPMPSDGLVPEQMIHALRVMGYDPLLLQNLPDTKGSRHLIYSYVESKIPVILLIQLASGGHHTVVVVSHGHETPIDNPDLITVNWPGEDPLEFSRSSNWVSHFLINDDQRGPYRKLTFLECDPSELQSKLESGPTPLTSQQVSDLGIEQWKCPISINTELNTVGIDGGEAIGNIWGAIVPLPHGVTLTSEQAERKAAHLIRFWHSLSSIKPPEGLVLRTYMISSSEYKKRLNATDMDDFVRLLYRGKPMPRWIWVTEISSVASYNAASLDQWLIKGEVIIDSTSSQWTGDFLAFHYIDESMKGVVFTMLPEHKDAEEALDRMWVAEQCSSYHGVIN